MDCVLMEQALINFSGKFYLQQKTCHRNERGSKNLTRAAQFAVLHNGSGFFHRAANWGQQPKHGFLDIRCPPIIKALAA